MKKLIFSVQVHRKTEVKEVYKKVFGKQLLFLNDKILEDTVISIPNVELGSEIKIALMYVPDTQGNEIIRSLGPSASIHMQELAYKLKNNVPV